MPLSLGVYDVFISDWIKVLGRENIFIFQTEEYEADPRKILTNIFDFLDLGKDFEIKVNVTVFHIVAQAMLFN